MKSTHVVFNRLIIALALATQLFLFAAPTQAAPHADTSNITQDNVNHADHNSMRSSRRSNRHCRERCARQYRQCRRGVANPNQARCRQRYNQCLRRCR
ncbi:MAG TPA: hypothetical protein VGX24_01710 [Pyrinomonadaceae bacterium]|jgi:hypothetical protein|nr:hypothetical protein [Pyrinomonadaceae bacterium]